MRKNPNLKCEIADTLSWDFLLYSCLITEKQYDYYVRKFCNCAKIVNGIANQIGGNCINGQNSKKTFLLAEW